MVTIRGDTLIACPVEEVFDFVADERNEPKYNPRMVRAEKITPGPIGRGTRWSATVEAWGRPLDLTIEITGYTRPNRLESTTTMSTAEIHGTVTFDPEPAGTRMQWSWELRPRGVLRFLAPIIARMGRRQEEEIWTGLQRYLENAHGPDGTEPAERSQTCAPPPWHR